MSGLPDGTVTFLFTDIEGSTRLLRRLGGRYAEVLNRHDRLVRAACADHGGREVNTQGDGFFVAFARAGDALAAAVQVQRQGNGGTWTTVATTNVSADGGFDASVDLSPGTYRARVIAGKGFAPGLSPVLTVVSA